MTKSYESAWYGTFKLSPDEPYPTPDSDLYPPKIYVRGPQSFEKSPANSEL